MDGSNAGTGIHIHDFSGIILSQSPLAPVSLGLALNYFTIMQTKSVVAVCQVEPIVHTPN